MLPKCPLCLVALLGAAGLGAGTASLIAPLLRPGAAVLAIAIFIAVVWSALRASLRARGKQPRCACATRGSTGTIDRGDAATRQIDPVDVTI